MSCFISQKLALRHGCETGTTSFFVFCRNEERCLESLKPQTYSLVMQNCLDDWTESFNIKRLRCLPTIKTSSLNKFQSESKLICEENIRAGLCVP